MNKDNLKSLLKDIKANGCNIKSEGYRLPEGITPLSLALVMTDYLGDTDDELRDDLIYRVLSNWITKRVLSDREAGEILEISLDDRHLFYGLGNADDTVFTRTFSLLVIAAAVYRHRSTGYLTVEKLKEILDKVLKQFNEDRDIRAYVEGKGWADGVSHGADVLDELARCKELGYDSLTRILDAIHDKVCINWYSYCHDEDERMVTAVSAILDKKLIPENEALAWIGSFEKLALTGHYRTDQTLRINVKSFLRSLYFRLLGKTGNTIYTDIILETLNRMNQYY